jgi:hypothetical protein
MRTQYLALFVAVSCLIGCREGTPAGPTQHDSQSVASDAAKALRTEVKMGAGTLKLSGGTSKWMEGDFSYNVASWKPVVKYSTFGTRGDLTIEQPSSNESHLNTTNDWDLRFNNDIPTELTVRLGAGEARLDLGSLALRNLEVEMGAGSLRLDLRGTPKHDYDVRVRGGAGEAIVHLPKDVGISAKASGGLGEIKVQGLRKDGDHWVNDGAASSKVQIHVDVQGGVGSISLIAE